METIRVVCAHDCPDMCSLLAHVENGRVLRIQGDPDQPFTAGFACAKVNRDAELVHSPERIATPLRRIGAKGEGRFAPITWDAALDEITARWKSIIAESGPLALLGYCYSSHQGLMNRGLPNGLFHAMGTSRLWAGTVCDSCMEAAWDATVGPIGGADPESVIEADLVICWGADLFATNVHFWAKLEQERKRGLKLVVIDPRRTRSAQAADWHIPIRIGTDAALALGIMHVLARDNLCDRDYIAQHTLGFDQRGTRGAAAFHPRPRRRHHRRRGVRRGAACRDVRRDKKITDPPRLGHDAPHPRRPGAAHRRAAARRHRRIWPLRRRRGERHRRIVRTQLQCGAQAVRPGDDAHHQPQLGWARRCLTLNDPPIRALFIAANNPAVTCPDTARTRRGLARDDLFTVVHDPFLTITARYADIVLPATTYLETEDFFRAYGTYYMQYSPQRGAAAGRGMVEPEARPVAGRAHGLSPIRCSACRRPEILRELFRGAKGALAAVDPDTLLDAGPISIATRDGQQFRTPSGKLEFYSEALAAQGLPPMPDWQPDPVEATQGAQWPLRLLTAPGLFPEPHCVFRCSLAARPRGEAVSACCIPADAAARNLREGEHVRLVNDRGAVGLTLHVRDEIQPGVVLVPGQRPDQEAVSGTVNMLCSDAFTDMGEGATYQSTWLDVRAW